MTAEAPQTAPPASVSGSIGVMQMMKDPKTFPINSSILEGRSLVWVLSQMRAVLEAQALERLAEHLSEMGAYAEQKHGYTIAKSRSSAPALTP